MKVHDKLRLDALHRIQNLCDTYAVPLALILEFTPLKALLDGIITKIEVARAINAQNITNFTTTKEVTCITMAETVYKFMLRGAIKAAELNLSGLEKSLSIAKYQIIKSDDAGIAVKCEEIKEILKTNITVLTNILPANITTMETVIHAYNLALDAPKEAIDKRSIFGTHAVNKLLNEADAHKINMGKIFHAYLPADVAAAFDLAAKIGKPTGRRHLSIHLNFLDVDTGGPVINVKTTFTKGSLSETRTSSKRGSIQIYSLEVGAWTATCESEIYKTVSQTNIDVQDKQTVHLLFKLIKKTTPDDGTTPLPLSYASINGKMYNSVTLEAIPNGLVFFQGVADPEETETDGTYSNDHVPITCTKLSATAAAYQDFQKIITLDKDSENEIDIPMDATEPLLPTPDS
ncbi:MAG: hypothetical protein WCQ95_11845 [Bacteroidota bacterium]